MDASWSRLFSAIISANFSASGSVGIKLTTGEEKAISTRRLQRARSRVVIREFREKYR